MDFGCESLVWCYIICKQCKTWLNGATYQKKKKKKKKHVKTHIIVVFKAFSQGFLLILLCNQRPVATNQLLTNRSFLVAVRSSCGLFPVHRTGPANTRTTRTPYWRSAWTKKPKNRHRDKLRNRNQTTSPNGKTIAIWFQRRNRTRRRTTDRNNSHNGIRSTECTHSHRKSNGIETKPAEAIYWKEKWGRRLLTRRGPVPRNQRWDLQYR